MLNLQLPQNEFGSAAAFTQAGDFLCAGTREACEQIAREHGGLYCWIDNGKPVLRTDFSVLDDDNVRLIHNDGRRVTIDLRTLRVDLDTMRMLGYPSSDDDQSLHATAYCDTTDGERIVLFACYQMPYETHGSYLNWMLWDGWRPVHAHTHEAGMLEQCIQAAIEAQESE